jgi:hypothetical protein
MCLLATAVALNMVSGRRGVAAVQATNCLKSSLKERYT